mgnify:CR=1 FL=1
MVWQGIQEEHIKTKDNVQITVDMVRQLREDTGLGMMACKKVLLRANGDLDKAKELLRKGYDPYQFCLVTKR